MLHIAIKTFTSVLIVLRLNKAFEEKNKNNILNSIYEMLVVVFLMMVLKL